MKTYETKKNERNDNVIVIENDHRTCSDANPQVRAMMLRNGNGAHGKGNPRREESRKACRGRYACE